MASVNLNFAVLVTSPIIIFGASGTSQSGPPYGRDGLEKPTTVVISSTKSSQATSSSRNFQTAGKVWDEENREMPPAATNNSSECISQSMPSQPTTPACNIALPSEEPSIQDARTGSSSDKTVESSGSVEERLQHQLHHDDDINQAEAHASYAEATLHDHTRHTSLSHASSVDAEEALEFITRRVSERPKIVTITSGEKPQTPPFARPTDHELTDTEATNILPIRSDPEDQVPDRPKTTESRKQARASIYPQPILSSPIRFPTGGIIKEKSKKNSNGNGSPVNSENARFSTLQLSPASATETEACLPLLALEPPKLCLIPATEQNTPIDGATTAATLFASATAKLVEAKASTTGESDVTNEKSAGSVENVKSIPVVPSQMCERNIYEIPAILQAARTPTQRDQGDKRHKRAFSTNALERPGKNTYGNPNPSNTNTPGVSSLRRVCQPSSPPSTDPAKANASAKTSHAREHRSSSQPPRPKRGYWKGIWDYLNGIDNATACPGPMSPAFAPQPITPQPAKLKDWQSCSQSNSAPPTPHGITGTNYQVNQTIDVAERSLRHGPSAPDPQTRFVLGSPRVVQNRHKQLPPTPTKSSGIGSNPVAWSHKEASVYFMDMHDNSRAQKSPVSPSFQIKSPKQRDTNTTDPASVHESSHTRKTVSVTKPGRDQDGNAYEYMNYEEVASPPPYSVANDMRKRAQSEASGQPATRPQVPKAHTIPQLGRPPLSEANGQPRQGSLPGTGKTPLRLDFEAAKNARDGTLSIPPVITDTPFRHGFFPTEEEDATVCLHDADFKSARDFYRSGTSYKPFGRTAYMDSLSETSDLTLPAQLE